jgi:hypothetical protein
LSAIYLGDRRDSAQAPLKAVLSCTVIQQAGSGKNHVNLRGFSTVYCREFDGPEKKGGQAPFEPGATKIFKDECERHLLVKFLHTKSTLLQFIKGFDVKKQNLMNIPLSTAFWSFCAVLRSTEYP